MSAFKLDDYGDGRGVVLEVDVGLLDERQMPWIDGRGFGFNLTNDEAAELYVLLRERIGEWHAESQRARRAVASGVSRAAYIGADDRDLDRDSLDPSDPRHPDFYDNAVSAWDNREWK